MRLRNLAILSFCAIFLACSNDDKIKPDNTQNQNPDNIVKYIGKYPEKFIFKIDPKGSISDYGAYYFTIQKNNKDGILKNWLVDYNYHGVKKNSYFEIISSTIDGKIKLNGYYETTDSKGNLIHGDSPDFEVDFSIKGIIKSTERDLIVFYY